MNIISLVSYPFLPARSGGQKGIALFYKYFSRYHQVTIVGIKNNQPELADGYELLNILPNATFRYINPFIFFHTEKTDPQKKGIRFHPGTPILWMAGNFAQKFCGVRLVVHSHNLEGNRWKSLGKWWWRILWNYEKFTHRHADFNFFIQDADRNYAIQNFGLNKDQCITVSFGTEISEPPSSENRAAAGLAIHQQLNIRTEIPLLLFNGAFSYSPNREALENLLFKINPLLQSRGLSYLLLICGLDIPDAITNNEYPSVSFLGFVENLDLYLRGCRTFLNPVQSGGGIKTKLVEALAYNLNVVSSENGAIGVDPALCNGKLIVCKNDDWNAFAESIVHSIHLTNTMPAVFYDHFYWANITRRAAEFIMDDR